MPRMWKVETVRVADLLEDVDAGELGLPEFQRPAVWGRSNWLPFLTAVLLDRPTGTLLLLEVDGPDSAFAARALDSAPLLDTNGLECLLLDGQQRTTTLYRSWKGLFPGRGTALSEVVVDVLAALERGELLEEDLTVVKRSDVAGPGDMAREGHVALRTLFSDGDRAVWEAAFVEHQSFEPGQLVEQMNQVIPGSRIGSYEFPVLRIKAETPLDVVVDIFEGMNRRGQRLNQFDLMVARLYRPGADGDHYKLRPSWEEALGQSPHLEKVGVGEEHGMLPLQLIALQVSRLPDDLRGRVKGLNNKDVLELPPSQVIGLEGAPIPGLTLEKATSALDDAAGFLSLHCGVVSPNLLPQQAMLLPLADQFLRDEDKRLSAEKLKRWFFAVGLAIDYYGSVNSFAKRDCDQLRDWAASGDQSQPQSVGRLSRNMIEELQLDQTFSREGNILGRTVMALLVANGALDWSEGQFQVSATQDVVEFHHMVPEQKLSQWFANKNDRRPIAALTPITASRNRAIRDQYPSQVMSDIGPDADQILLTHHVDRKKLEAAVKSKSAFNSLVADRERRLKRFIVQALGLS